MIESYGSASRRRGQLLLLAIAMAAGGYARTAISPLQETLRVALSLSDNQMAFVQGPIVGVPVAIAALPLGFLIDRRSRVRMVFVFVLLSLLATVATAFSADFSILLLSRGMAGLVALATVPVVFSLVSDLYAPTQRGRATTVVCIGQIAGNAVAFALGGTLLGMAGSGADGWRTAVIGLSVPLIPVVLLTLALREPTRTGVTIANASPRQIYRELKDYRSVIGALMMGIILAETAVGAMMVWAGPMLSREFGLAPAHTGALMAVGMLISGVIGTTAGGVVADLSQRAGGPTRTTSILSGLAVLGTFTSLYSFVSGLELVSLLLVATMTLMTAIAVIGMTVFSILIPNELRGLCMSVLVALNIVFSLALAPPLVSVLSGAMGGLAMIGQALSIVCMVASLTAAVAFGLLRRLLRRFMTFGSDPFVVAEHKNST